MKYFLLLLVLFTISSNLYSQCEEGETEVFVHLYTDNWGYELYWQLTDQGEECGLASIFEAGNIIEVGCEGPQDEVDATGGNGYANNEIFIEGPFCLANTQEFDIIHVDDYGDGGTVFEIYQDGIITSFFEGTGTGNVFTFTAGDLTPAFIDGDRPCESFEIFADGDSVVLENAEATASPGEVSPPEGYCGAYGQWCESNDGASNTMWVAFTPEDTGSYEVSSCNELNDFDTAIAVYSAENCADFSSFTLISSNDDSYVGCDQGSTGFASICYISCLNVGETYYIQLDGWNGDTGTSEITVSSYEGDIEVNSYVQDVQCANVKGETGSGIVPQINGMGINYDVAWEGPNNFTSDERVLENIAGGEYTCTITNDCGFSTVETYVIEIPALVAPNFTSMIVSCPELENGTISTDISGGEEPYEISWSGPENFQSFDPSLENLAAGAYFLEIEDDNGCEYTFQYSLEAGNDLEFSLGADPTLCLDETIEFEGPTGFYIFEWQDGSDNSTFDFSAQENGEGIFPINLTISDQEGCSFTDVVNVVVENCLDISEMEEVNIEIYPNPSKGVFRIKNSSNKSVQVKILDSRGKEVYNKVNYNTDQIDVSSLTAGVYHLIILDSGLIYQEKLILSK